MAKTPILDDRTLEWARDRFSEYYANATIAPPSRLPRREFAWFPFKAETLMRRHATLRSPREFGSYLHGNVPRHVYYSSAYYHRPEAPTMAAKGWMGADLIFDLDSDHLRGAADLPYAGQLALVKNQLLRLVDDFLARDFGLDPSAMSISFSGGRGYHVHVQSEELASLSSPERRELVDYVLGTGTSPERAIQVVREHSDETSDSGDGTAGSGRFGKVNPTRTLVSEGAPGWSGRASRAFVESLTRWVEVGREETRRDLKSYGLSPKQAAAYSRHLIDQGAAVKILNSRATDGSYSIDVKQESMALELLDAVARGASVQVQGETDAPVTTDIHRLIRLPGSLHGGTGFRVVPLTRDAVDSFDPFRDALSAPAGGTSQRVTFTESVDYPFPGGGVRGSPGGTDELPTPVALFLLLRQEAALPPSPA